MKKLCRFLNLVCGLLFIGGSVWYIFYIHSMPYETYNFLSTNHILLPFYLLLATGLLTFIFSQALGSDIHEKSVVYVDQISKKKSVVDSTKSGSSENSGTGESILAELEVIAKKESGQNIKAEKMLSYLSHSLKAGQGIIYGLTEEDAKSFLFPLATFAYSKEKNEALRFELGEGLAGLAAKENKLMLLDNLPQGYVQVFSGLGNASPNHLLILPILFKEKVVGVLELALFEKLKFTSNVFFNDLSAKLGSLLVTQGTAK